MGCAAISTFGSREISRAATTFCWLPPDSAPGRRERTAAAHVELLDQVLRARDEPLREQPAPTSSPAAPRSRAARCSRRARTRARDRGAGGPRGCARAPRRAASRADAWWSSRPPTRMTPRSARLQPGQSLDQLGLAVPVDSGDADDLAGTNLEGHAAHLLDAAVVATPTGPPPRAGRRPASAGCFSTRRSTSRPTIARASDSSVAPSRGTVSIVLPASEHGDAVGDLEHLVQLVADEDDRDALPAQRAQDLEQIRRLLGRQHGGRLVEDQDVGVPVERLHDLDALLLADADVLDERARLDREVERLRHVGDPLLRCRLVEQDAVLDRLSPEHDVLGDGHHRNEHEVLVHHADACPDCVARRENETGFPFSRISPASGR